MKGKIIMVIMALLIIITVFAAANAINYYSLYKEAVESASQSQIVHDREGTSPAVVLSNYVTALKTGDSDLMNSLLSKNYIENSTYEGKGVPEFQPQEISDALIMINDYESNNEYEANYILQFNVVKESEPVFFYGGEHYYFVKLVYEDGGWKIDSKATSP